MAKKKAGVDLPKLTETEQDLVWHMEHGYRLETDSLGGDPVLRRLKDDEVVRLASANRNTVKSLEERGLRCDGVSWRRPPIERLKLWESDGNGGLSGWSCYFVLLTLATSGKRDAYRRSTASGEPCRVSGKVIGSGI